MVLFPFGIRNDLPVDSHAYIPQVNMFTRVFDCLLDRNYDSAAAGNFHTDDCNRPDVIIRKNCGKFIGIFKNFVKFRASDGEGFVTTGEELLVKVGHGEPYTVGGDDYVGVGPDVTTCREQRQLNRKLRHQRLSNTARVLAGTGICIFLGIT